MAAKFGDKSKYRKILKDFVESGDKTRELHYKSVEEARREGGNLAWASRIYNYKRAVKVQVEASESQRVILRNILIYPEYVLIPAIVPGEEEEMAIENVPAKELEKEYGHKIVNDLIEIGDVTVAFHYSSYSLVVAHELVKSRKVDIAVIKNTDKETIDEIIHQTVRVNLMARLIDTGVVISRYYEDSEGGDI